jgi:hypothetical protein
MITASPRHSICAVAVNGLAAGLAVVALMAFIMLARELATSTAGHPRSGGAGRPVLVHHLDRAGRVVGR